jgi:type VI secretion system protein ImpC
MRRDSDNAAFFEAPSCKSVGTFPDTTQGKKDETNARLGMSFPYLMIQCRLAHYLKVIWRENIGRIMDSQKMLGEITDWISQYCRTGTLDDDLAARYPLEQVTVGVEPVEGKPGVYRAAIKMKPHFRLTDVKMELSMVGQLDPSP